MHNKIFFFKCKISVQINSIDDDVYIIIYNL